VLLVNQQVKAGECDHCVTRQGWFHPLWWLEQLRRMKGLRWIEYGFDAVENVEMCIWTRKALKHADHADSCSYRFRAGQLL
jgi:hypothetical protein